MNERLAAVFQQFLGGMKLPQLDLVRRSQTDFLTGGNRVGDRLPC